MDRGATSSPSNSTYERSLSTYSGLPDDIMATSGSALIRRAICRSVSGQLRTSHAHSAVQQAAILKGASGPNRTRLWGNATKRSQLLHEASTAAS